ncbi:O-antigen ligase family protein [Sphingopyxis sp. H115]|uniref:O-antigen ligase family protein n=1 Tax=Sphingopyxis sp. H115 TaxID=1759073 RepID=UPI00073766A7|nr:O-antigen ligase family protein [Sphingopyxis sp. H115]KTE17789.1 hypothetical protein ATE71_01445 [Sphingopyxis sp. H115]
MFLVMLFLTGGSARSDVASLPLLRAGALLFGFWAMLRMTREDWRRIRVPLLLLVALLAWMVVQLVPLPPDMWQALPGRETIAAIDKTLGQADIWRPLSLTPSQTLNSVLAMTVPFAALFLFAQADADEQRRLLFAVVGIGCASALLGVIQLLSGASSGAYLYRITNSDAMVGLFANRNHHSIFLACILVVVAMLLRDELMRKRKRTTVRAGLVAAGVLLTAMTALIGSRAGLFTGVVAFAAGYLSVVAAWRSRPAESRRAAVPAPGWTRALVYAPPLIVAGVVGAALWLSDRTTGLTRLIENDAVADMRVQAWPVVQSMVERFWLWGSGFGSFPDTYKIYETDALLQPAYYNHAHNDWAEIVITGGLPFVLILLAAILWVARSFAARGTRNLIKGYRGDVRLSALLIILLLAAASVVDYPLRVPSIQAFAILILILLCCPKPATTRGD